MSAIIDAIGLTETQQYFERAPDIARRAAVLSINQTAERKGLKAARDAMLLQVAFPPGYLQPPNFFLSQRATVDDMTAAIRGRFTPTSLARFAGGARSRFAAGRRHVRRNGGGIALHVQPGASVVLKRAFFLNLRGGNIGLAIRLKPGEVLLHTRGAKLLTSGPLAGVALLYGPSVDQVFRTVAAEIAPGVLDAVETEFLRQFIRLSQ